MANNHNHKTVLEKLEQLDQRCRDIERQVSDPAVASNTARLVPLAKEQGKLMPIVSRYRQYRKLSAQLEEAQAILDDPAAEAEITPRYLVRARCGLAFHEISRP